MNLNQKFVSLQPTLLLFYLFLF